MILIAKRDSFRGHLTTAAVVANAPIHFGVDFTVGRAGLYDPATGIFTVTTPGLYFVEFQLFPERPAAILMDMYLKGGIKVRSRCYDSTADATSCAVSTVLQLHGGDTLWLQTGHAGTYYTFAHSFFAVTLLSPEP
ncbi:hypothetical protein ACOMHN_012566 [Nucella lapillus]